MFSSIYNKSKKTWFWNFVTCKYKFGECGNKLSEHYTAVVAAVAAVWTKVAFPFSPQAYKIQSQAIIGITDV